MKEYCIGFGLGAEMTRVGKNMGYGIWGTLGIGERVQSIVVSGKIGWRVIRESTVWDLVDWRAVD